MHTHNFKTYWKFFNKIFVISATFGFKKKIGNLVKAD
jgi:hypothetical protein